MIYFSTSILRSVFHSQAGIISTLVLLVKLPASVLTIFLLPRMGSQNTLTRCYLAMFGCLLLLAVSLNASWPFVSFAAVIGYFLTYGLGPGPVTWVVLSEVLPSEARTAGSSLGQACAAVTGFITVSPLSSQNVNSPPFSSSPPPSFTLLPNPASLLGSIPSHHLPLYLLDGAVLTPNRAPHSCPYKQCLIVSHTVKPTETYSSYTLPSASESTLSSARLSGPTGPLSTGPCNRHTSQQQSPKSAPVCFSIIFAVYPCFS